MRYILALVLVFMLTCPAEASGVILDLNSQGQVFTVEVNTPAPEAVRGLRFIKKIRLPGDKKKIKQYTYEMNDGTMYVTTDKIEDVPDLTKFDDSHPRWARIRDIVQVAGTILSFAIMVVGPLLLLL